MCVGEKLGQVTLLNFEGQNISSSMFKLLDKTVFSNTDSDISLSKT